MIFFWMPETAYVRTGVVNVDTGSNDVCRPISILSSNTNQIPDDDRNYQSPQDGYRTGGK